MNAAPAQVRRDPLAAFRLDTLLEGAARLRPGHVMLCEADGSRAMTFQEMAAHATRFAARLAAAGFGPGETMLLAGGNCVATVAALFGGLRAGLNVALVPPGLRVDRIAMLAGELGAGLLACGEQVGEIDLLGKGFNAAALCDAIRMVATLAPGAADAEDAADFSIAGLERDMLPSVPVPVPVHAHGAHVITLARREGRMVPVPHIQRGLVAATLDLIAQAQLSANQPLISTLMPHTLAGLVAGPLAALLSGSKLNLHALFDSAILAAQMHANPDSLVIVPVALLPAFAGDRPYMPGALLAVSRWQDRGADFSPPHDVLAPCPVIDLHAFGETALVAERRTADGRARALLDPPHDIEIGGERLLAVDADSDNDGGFRFYGAAVTENEI